MFFICSVQSEKEFVKLRSINFIISHNDVTKVAEDLLGWLVLFEPSLLLFSFSVLSSILCNFPIRLDVFPMEYQYCKNFKNCMGPYVVMWSRSYITGMICSLGDLIRFSCEPGLFLCWMELNVAGGCCNFRQKGKSACFYSEKALDFSALSNLSKIW